ncbi:MerR family transcriptional regulator [Pontibacillus halophilus JSM 076056 = DSM 19796]|uniref:MerR family transcriptional regulator n=1 Tax=Pontibacillus halophilus JSM 076056 = DSM 19796 TaxID=1385510 RepID=A0A0A5GG15_9BACI|nr:MerR family transcriptional regulator [Pontibacillus halophilus]KGX92191.1 MerR family transcriptional regulator [Pontibacillus halophilus JSM 076056 = DSM 19796]
MSSQQGKYNIKALCNMLGIQAGTLRAWERRYQIIRPQRNSAGHRVYTEEHVKVLKWLMDKVDKGFTISQAVSLLENQNTDQREDESEEEQFETRTHQQQISYKLQKALLSFDEKLAHSQLDYAFSIFTPEKVAIEVIGPILVDIGTLWERNEISSAHEHFATNFLRSRVGMMLISLPSDQTLPKAICVCGPNEKHELGLLIFALFLKRKGYEVIYLGQSLAPGDAHVVIDEVQPKYLFMSCTLKKNIPTTVSLAKALKEKFPTLDIGLGGYAYDSLPKEEKLRLKPFLLGTNRQEWEEWLATHEI